MFDDLREQLRERATEIASKVQETSAFNSAREWYESQSARGQLIVKALMGTVLAIVFIYPPYSYISSSSDYLEQFETNRSLIQGLLRASQSAKEPPALPPPMPSSNIKSRIQNVTMGQKLTAEQIGPMEDVPQEAYASFVPAGVEFAAVVASIKKLTLRQIIEIGNAIQNMAPGVKLMGLDVVQSPGMDHYYDVNFQVASFGIQPVADDEPSPPPRGREKPSSKEEDEGDE
ncbi:MAG: hypothetical protein AB7F86_12435 [Bdellovibrionales bacterium]